MNKQQSEENIYQRNVSSACIVAMKYFTPMPRYMDWLYETCHIVKTHIKEACKGAKWNEKFRALGYETRHRNENFLRQQYFDSSLWRFSSVNGSKKTTCFEAISALRFSELQGEVLESGV